MQEMFSAFHAWKEKFQDRIFDLGDKLKPTGKVVDAKGVTDGPYAESKEVIAGYMIVQAESYEFALQVADEMPGSKMPGASVEIRELAGMQA